uniref:SAM domain-containing protein n=1 Tax=Trichobilharzia regenti TaxID=157069 RepID=A0AA85J1H6_TRIRE|nr:unnamed protein product [Trichobilharzia regenti]
MAEKTITNGWIHLVNVKVVLATCVEIRSACHDFSWRFNMFPCASHLEDRSNSTSDHFRDDESWLKSSTYTEKSSSSNRVHGNSSHEVQDLKTTGKRSHSYKKDDIVKKKPKVTSTAVFLEDIPGLNINDAYRIDKTYNKEIYKHGCVYEKHVSRYNQKSKTKILGFKDLRLSDLVGSEVKCKPGVIKKSRYFSKSSKAVIRNPPVTVKACESINDTATDLIPLVDRITIQHKPVEEVKNCEMLNLCEELNRRVYDRPGDIISWLDLIDLQDKGASFLHIASSDAEQKQTCTDFKYSKSDRLIILKKQLSMADRALTANPVI